MGIIVINCDLNVLISSHSSIVLL